MFFPYFSAGYSFYEMRASSQTFQRQNTKRKKTIQMLNFV